MSDPNKAEDVRKLLRATFHPDGDDVDNDALEGVLGEIAAHDEDQEAGDGIYREKLGPAENKESSGVQGYYYVEAKHHRTRGCEHEFVGKVFWARVSLPQATGLLGPWPFRTRTGRILKRDHFYDSVAQINQAFSLRFGGDVDRVDLVAPGRYNGGRFSAGSLYLCYQGDTLLYWVAEGGTALGKEKATYAALAGREATENAKFAFTGFTGVNHFYRIDLTMDDAGHHPTQLRLRAYLGPNEDEDDPYLTNTISLSPRTGDDLVAGGVYTPGSTVVVAGNRINAISQKLPENWWTHRGSVEMTKALFHGKTVEWIQKPTAIGGDND